MSSASLSRSFAAIASAVLLGLAACASTPVPNEHVAVAKSSVARAEQSGAPELAPVELATAREKIGLADQAAAKGHVERATQLAEEADVDAKLAEATAAQKRAHKAALEFDASMRALRDESNRSTPTG